MADRTKHTSNGAADANLEWRRVPSSSDTGGTEPAVTEPSPRPRRHWISWLSRAIFVVAIGLLTFAVYRMWTEGAAVVQRQHVLAGSFVSRMSMVDSGTPLEDLAAPVTGPETPDSTQPVGSEQDSDDPRMAMPESVYAPAEITQAYERPRIPGMLWEGAPQKGEVLGRVVIPAIDLEWMVIEGVDLQYLKSGPGHMAWTPVPGQPGNAVISGHRTTYGAPFHDLDLLVPGDRIEVTTLTGTHVYEVYDSTIVLPDGVWVTHQWEGAWLTLTTCNPKGSSTERYIVFAELVEGTNFDAIDASTGRTPPERPEGA